MKRCLRSVVVRPRGVGVEDGRKRAHIAGSTEAASGLAAT